MPTLKALQRWLFLSILVWTSVASPSVHADNNRDKTAAELATLQQQIQQTDRERRAQQQQFEAAEKALQQADRALAESSNAVREQQQQLAKVQQQLQQLSQQSTQLEQQRQQQQALLAQQVRSAYQVGGHDYTQLLLNQENAAKLERLLTYYQYFNNARMQQLTALKQTTAQLSQLTAEMAAASAIEQQKLQELTAQQDSMQAAKTQQQTSVKKLAAALQDQKQQLAYLQSNAKSLQSTLDRLKAEAERRKLMAKRTQPGKMPWPVRGSIIQNFGISQGGGMSTRGLIIQAPAGTTVKAVANGQVVYADWLKGYGWVTVVDHGNGLMSLYGHNQSLLKRRGDDVVAGDALALVGQSGGQSQAGLYFEIRQKGTAVDPRRWLQAQ